MATPARERRVVWRRQVQTHHLQDRPQEALGLAQGKMEDQTEGERGLDGQVGKLLLATSLASTCRNPGGDVIRGPGHRGRPAT